MLDLRKGYTIDEVEDLDCGRLVKMSAPAHTQRRSRFNTTFIAAMVGVGCGAIAGVSLTLAAQAATAAPDVSKMGPEMTPESVQLVLEVAEEAQVSENPMEAELIESALLEQGYFREDVPLSFEIQDTLHTVCEANGIPYHVALGLIETESGFDPAAVSPSGCYGLAQLNPEYFPSGLSPTENITTGMEFLAYQLDRYDGDMGAALTAYNAGHDTGARGYATAVLEAAEKWQ